MTAARDNNGKPMLSFILQFPTACEAHARVKEIGAIKYERDNWRKGGKPDYEYLDAALRHIIAFMQGEMFAEDTGCTHLGHAMWNIMALQDLNYPGVTHDPELFGRMCQYWKARREVEANGMEFPSVEEWLRHIDAAMSDENPIPTEELLKENQVQSFDFPGFGTFYFSEPVSVRSDQRLQVDLTEGIAKVLNKDGEVIDAVELVDNE